MLLDLFRRGDVASDVRLAAARGELAPRAREQLELLVWLVSDPEPEIATAAEATLAMIPRDRLAACLAHSDVPVALRSFFGARGIEPVPHPGVDLDAPLFQVDPDPESEPASGDEHMKEGALERIAALNVAKRVALAMKGSREERGILIRDSNKMVAAAVLSGPKLTQTEVESIARMANVSDEILRIIAQTRAWVKNYGVVVALTKNPKTPVAVSMQLLSRLTERDLRVLSTDRNVPDLLRLTARKKIAIDR